MLQSCYTYPDMPVICQLILLVHSFIYLLIYGTFAEWMLYTRSCFGVGDTDMNKAKATPSKAHMYGNISVGAGLWIGCGFLFLGSQGILQRGDDLELNIINGTSLSWGSDHPGQYFVRAALQAEALSIPPFLLSLRLGLRVHFSLCSIFPLLLHFSLCSPV